MTFRNWATAIRAALSQGAAFHALSELPWTRVTGRRDELGLVADRRHELVALLERFWPAWRDGLADLTAHGWRKPLREAEAATLRKAREGLCQEWAAAEGVSVQKAAEEVDALLLEGRKAFVE